MTQEAGKYYFEDLELGSVFSSPGRTVTETDIVIFAGLSADYNMLHTDAEYSKNTVFGERIAHGLLGLAIASGLFTRTELNRMLNETVIAMLGINSWRFTAPIKIGDTVHLEIEITSKKETSKPDRGVVAFKRRLINQRGEVVQEGEIPLMIKRKEIN
jgi:acyl dehydratase